MTSPLAYIQNNPLPTTGNNIAPSFAQKNITNPIEGAFSSGIGEIGSGYNETQQPGNPLQKMGNLISGGAHMAEGALGAIASPLAPVVQRPVGAVVNAVANKVSDNPNVQNFAMSPAGQTTSKIAGAVNTTANIAGGTAGLEGGVESARNIWDKAYGGMTGTSAVDSAQAGVNTQANTAATSLQNATQDLANYRNSTMGQEFAKAPQEIMQQNPNAHVVVPNEILDRLNELKDSAKFQLPDYLRTSSQEFGNNVKLTDIPKNGVSLNPAEAQDLITRLNKLTYSSNAAGDLKVNQSTQGLVNDLHSLSSDAFGNIKNTAGESIWNKAYSNFSKSANIVSKMSDLINIDKNAGPMDMFNKLNAFKKLLSDPSGKVLLTNAVDELKQTTGVDLTNPTQEIGKLMDSEEMLKEAQKPGFFKQMFSPNMVGRLGMRVIMYATLGAWIKGAIKSISQ